MKEQKNKEELILKARKICSGREYCVNDIREKLSAWGADDKETDEIIIQLKNENFINENRYAGAFARDRFKYQKWGKVKITAQMKLKHLPSEIIRESLLTIDEDEYRNALKEILLTRKKNLKSKNQYELKGQLIRHALSKGFESGLVYEMVNEIAD